jgi:pyridinium-3,5-bisthiocarboxylic acid mononucleotide nickel chelatase
VGATKRKFLILVVAPCYVKLSTMKTGYLDAFSGLSGDMIAGALIDAGADFDALEHVVARLGMRGYTLAARRKSVSGIAAIKFEVGVADPQPERHLGEIRAMIESAGLSPKVTHDAVLTFQVLAEAEAKVHHTTTDKVHFHEVGSVDSIIDIVVSAWGLDHLGVSDLMVSEMPMGSGFAKSRHGTIPVPAPATAELLGGFPVRLGDGLSEMVTPTGAAIVRALARPAPAILPFEIERVGYGAGAKDFSDRPNVLRLLLGQRKSAVETDELIEIAANIDDLNPQIYDHVSEQLFAAGARDVTLTPTIMKKGRPGIMLSVLAEATRRDQIAGILFAETSTIGVRFHPVARLKLARRMIEVETRFGKIRVKISGDSANPATIAPEYDDCHSAALAHNTPLKVVIQEAQETARRILKT